MATLVLTLAALMWLPVRWASADDAATPIRVYYTADEARHKIFPEAVRFELETHFIPRQAKLDLEGQLGRSFAEDSLKVYLAYDADNLAGYAVVSNEIGKYQPITFMVGVTVDFRVQGAAILIYRESRGAEVRRTRFLKQYRDKTSRDPIRINRDIVNITGATLSVRALNFGVRKLLAITEHLYGHRAAFK
jgi:Na+-translocating ferredoxin:NAD+ oxidoreductase RnfG subunit